MPLGIIFFPDFWVQPVKQHNPAQKLMPLRQGYVKRKSWAKELSKADIYLS